jgi:O-antigen/teichoic acid export membrane protein
MIVVMFSSFIATTLLGRNLSLEEFGEFSLVKNLLTVGPSLAILGLDYSYIRLYHSVHPLGLNRFVFMVTFLATLILTFVIYHIYGIQGYKIILVFCALWAGTISLYLASYNRKTNRFFLAQLIQAGWKIIFLIIIVSTMLIAGNISVDIVYISFSLGFGTFVLFSFHLISDLKRDSTNTTELRGADLKQLIKYGGMIWLMNGITLLFGSLDKLLIPYFIDHIMLGIYTGTSFVFTISFTMLGSAVGYVLFPAISRGEKIQWGKIISYNGIVLIVMLILFLMIGKSLVNILFKKKFMDYTELSLILLFSMLGILRFIHTVLHFIIISLGERKIQIQYITFAIFVNILLFGMFYAVGYFGVFNLSIIARMILIVWTLKSLQSGYLAYKLVKLKKLGYST